MSNESEILELLRRERLARKQAEVLLEEKSLELYHSNKQLSELNSTLEARIQQRTHELEQAKNLAEKADANKTQFLSRVSHELRTPLNAIIGFANLLKSKNLEGESEEFLNAILISSTELLDTINDVLDLAKIEAGEQTVFEESVEIIPFLDKIGKTFRRLVANKQVDFRMHLDQLLPKQVLTDKLKLTQIINNLISNAVKFTHTGHVEFRVSFNSQTSRLNFSISDTGIGIPEKELNTLFDPFKQAHSAESAKIGGTGLGLAITKQLVLLLGGSIEVKSKWGEGSNFVFEIPTKVIQLENSPNEENKPVEKTPLNLDGITVLIVDDVPFNVKMLQFTLQNVGCNILIAENGIMACQIHHEKKPDIVLMDLQMPEMDGFEATSWIRKSDSITPIIALTADAFPQTKELVLKNGMNDFLSKPVDVELLKTKIHHYVRLI